MTEHFGRPRPERFGWSSGLSSLSTVVQVDSGVHPSVVVSGPCRFGALYMTSCERADLKKKSA